MGKRLFLNGGENTHLFPVVSKLGTTVETNHIRSGKRGGLAAALSWLAGLGKADSFMPASEQSVKNLHKLLPAVASSYRSYSLISALPGSSSGSSGPSGQRPPLL